MSKISLIIEREYLTRVQKKIVHLNDDTLTDCHGRLDIRTYLARTTIER